jgi:hypothetical protein
MTNSNMFHKIRELESDTVTSEELNTIDKLWVNIRLQAEARVGKQHKDWWHTDIPLWKEELRQCNNTIKT